MSSWLFGRLRQPAHSQTGMRQNLSAWSLTQIKEMAAANSAQEISEASKSLGIRCYENDEEYMGHVRRMPSKPIIHRLCK